MEGWPPGRLVEPPLPAAKWPRWEDFPQPLRNDVECYLTALAKARRGPTGKRLRPCKPSTILTRRTELISFAKKAVRLGVPMSGLSSLAALLNPVLVERILDDQWKRDGEEP